MSSHRNASTLDFALPASLDAPDLLLPSQMASAALPDVPERRLLVAMLERALLDAMGRAGTGGPADTEDALAWFHSEADTPFSFVWVAAQLGLDPDWLRDRVERCAQRLAA